MPAKIQVDENLVFLYRCLLNSDCETIDFNAVGAATNLKASAAAMRYRRLKKNVEARIGSSRNRGPSASVKAVKKVKPTTSLSKKRKVAHEIEDEEYSAATLDKEIGNVLIKEEGLQAGNFGRRTRGKKIDLKDAFDSDSSIGLRRSNQEGGSSDDDRMEDVSDDDEEYHADEADEEEDDQPIARLQKAIHSRTKMTDNAKSAITTSRKSSKRLARSVLDGYAEENATTPNAPVTPEPEISGASETKAKSAALPPTPQSMPTGTNEQTHMNSILIKSEPHPSAIQLSPVARLNKTRHAAPQPSLFDRIENARIRADHNLYSLSHHASKTYRPRNYTETILPSIEHDDDDSDNSGAMLRVRSRSSRVPSRSVCGTTKVKEDDQITEDSDFSTRHERSGSPTVSSLQSVESESPSSKAATAADTQQQAPAPQRFTLGFGSCNVQ